MHNGSRAILSAGLAVAILAALVMTASCRNKEQKRGGAPPVAVTVATVEQKDVPVQIRAIGNIEAYSTIQVKAQIGGQLMKVHFREGQDVSAGDLLFTIDPRPYEAQIKQAEANLAKDNAQLAYAREEAQRYAELAKKGYVAREQYEQFHTNAAALESTVNADRAVLENARLQLKYCYIYSPITGRTGNLAVNAGNLVKANADTAMLTINQIEPIYATFSVPERDLAEIKKYTGQGKLGVDAFIAKDDTIPERGVLTFIDNAVDLNTGTIRLKGTFANEKRKLWPGQFVNVVLTLTTRPGVMLVPASAVQTGQEGQYLFVVKGDNTVESRPVTVGISVGDQTVIDKGVAAGEKVVTDGQLQLVSGSKVDIKQAGRETEVQAESPKASTGGAQ